MVPTLAHCPVCAGSLDPDDPHCGACGLSTTDPRFAELEDLDTWMAAAQARRDWLVAALRAAPPAPPGRSTDRSTLGDRSDLVPPHVVVEPPGRRGTQQLLLSAGAALLVAATVALTVTGWGMLPSWVKLGILAAVSAAALLGGLALRRAEMTATAESVEAVGLAVAAATGAFTAMSLDGGGHAVALAAVAPAGLAAVAHLVTGRRHLPPPVAIPTVGETVAAGAPIVVLVVVASMLAESGAGRGALVVVASALALAAAVRPVLRTRVAEGVVLGLGITVAVGVAIAVVTPSLAADFGVMATLAAASLLTGGCLALGALDRRPPGLLDDVASRAAGVVPIAVVASLVDAVVSAPTRDALVFTAGTLAAAVVHRFVPSRGRLGAVRQTARGALVPAGWAVLTASVTAGALLGPAPGAAVDPLAAGTWFVLAGVGAVATLAAVRARPWWVRLVSAAVVSAVVVVVAAAALVAAEVATAGVAATLGAVAVVCWLVSAWAAVRTDLPWWPAPLAGTVLGACGAAAWTPSSSSGTVLAALVVAAATGGLAIVRWRGATRPGAVFHDVAAPWLLAAGGTGLAVATGSASWAAPVALGLLVVLAAVGHLAPAGHGLATASVAVAGAGVWLAGAAGGGAVAVVTGISGVVLALLCDEAPGSSGGWPAPLAAAAAGASAALAWVTGLDVVADLGGLPIEAITVPVALCTVPFGVSRWRGGASSWVALGPALAVLALGAVAGPADPTRLLAVAVVAAAVAAVGVRAELMAPAVVGAVTAVWATVVLLAPLAESVPTWLGFAAVGATLVFLGATFDRRRAQVVAVGERLSELR